MLMAVHMRVLFNKHDAIQTGPRDRAQRESRFCFRNQTCTRCRGLLGSREEEIRTESAKRIIFAMSLSRDSNPSCLKATGNSCVKLYEIISIAYNNVILAYFSILVRRFLRNHRYRRVRTLPCIPETISSRQSGNYRFDISI